MPGAIPVRVMVQTWAAGDNMRRDAFSDCHPGVNFLFFLGAIGCGVVIQHPAYLLAGLFGAGLYSLLLNERKGLKLILGLIPMALILTAVNPLFNTAGKNVLFYVFGRPYTLEALLYGGAIAGIFGVMILWFQCYQAVLTSDKFTCLFGNLIPALSMILVMVLRMIPNFTRKAKQIAAARKSIGKGSGSNTREKLGEGMTVLSTLTDWALEGSVVSGDSMRARGYGAAKRTSFQIYTLTARDKVLLGLIAALLAVVLYTAARGGVTAAYTPELMFVPLNGENAMGFSAYCIFLLIPSVMHIKEAIQWRSLQSKI